VKPAEQLLARSLPSFLQALKLAFVEPAYTHVFADRHSKYGDGHQEGGILVWQTTSLQPCAHGLALLVIDGELWRRNLVVTEVEAPSFLSVARWT
jgi:hypothetical protein